MLKRWFLLQSQSGFTLIEIMIALILGLLISAVVIQIYLMSVKTTTLQKTASELQQASIFGIQQLENHIRLANLGNPTSHITSDTVQGGIVLTGTNLGIFTIADTGEKLDSFAQVGYLSRSAGDVMMGERGWTGISNTDIPSDQLTIQYQNITENVMTDCEGNDIEINDIVIERYFLREVTGGRSKAVVKDLVLACDAGRLAIGKVGRNTLQVFAGTDQRNFGQAGQEFITGIEQFKVLLGVQYLGQPSSTISYIPSKDYLEKFNNAVSEKPMIIAIKMGMIVRGDTPLVNHQHEQKFILLGKTQQLKSAQLAPKYLRTVYEATTFLRNARLISIHQQ